MVHISGQIIATSHDLTPNEQRFLVGSFNLDKLCLVKCWRRHLGAVRRLA